MKLFSRKALVAGAAAVALSFAGTSAAVAEQAPSTETVNTQDTSNTGDDDKDKDNGLSSKGDDDKNEGSSDATEISAWISVFTAVIGALGALFSFASKYLGFKL